MKIKKRKVQEKCVIERNVKFKDCKSCLEATQLENEKNHSENNKSNVDSLKGNRKEFIRINGLILKLQQRFRSLKHKIFTEEINKAVLSANDDTRISSKYFLISNTS